MGISTITGECSNNYGGTVLQRAAVVRLLLMKDGVDVNAKEHEGWTALQRATEGGYEAVVRLLKLAGAD